MSLDIFSMYHYCSLLPEESFLCAIKSEFVCILETSMPWTFLLPIFHYLSWFTPCLSRLDSFSFPPPPCNFRVFNETGTMGDDSIWWSRCAVRCSLLCGTAAAERKHFSTAFQVFPWLLSYLLQKSLEHVFYNKPQEGWVKCPLNRMII